MTSSRVNSHNQTALLYLEAAYKAGHTKLADKVKAALRKDLNEQKKYYDYLRAEKEEFFNSISRDADINDYMIKILDTIEGQYGGQTSPIPENPATRSDTTGRDTTRSN